MKLVILSVIFTFLLTVQAEVTWDAGGPYNLTCTGHDDGHISCKPEDTEILAHKAEVDAKPNQLEIAELGESGGHPHGLEKRVTCNIDQRLCFAHCFALGYCNSHCDSRNICICNCKDKFPYICVRTSCS